MRTFLLLLVLPSLAFADSKYGPNAVPLSKQSNVAYFQHNPAPDYWTLAGFYLPEPTGTSCSAANFAMVLNAARSKLPLGTQDKLVTYKNLLEDYTDDKYKAAMMATKPLEMEHGAVANARLAAVLREAMEKLKLNGPKAKVELVSLDMKNLKASKERFLKDLAENEKSSDDYIILSGYVQGRLTGDPEGLVSHVATVGAYDAKKKLVLLFEPDREWYEPYWSPVDAVWESIADPKSDTEHPGYLYVRFR